MIVNETLPWVALASRGVGNAAMRYADWKKNVKRLAKRMRSRSRMQVIHGGSIPSSPGELRLFLVVRNEALRLPFLLKYARSIGIDRVIALDNGSTDGTLDILREEPNTHILQTSETYRRHGTWFDVLLNDYGIGHWCWLADADELLAYPHCDRAGLRLFTRYLDERGWDAMPTVLVDFYPRGPIHHVPYHPGSDFRVVSPWFDPPNYRKIPYIFERCRSSLHYRLTGGLRLRAFGQQICCTNFPLVKFHRMMFLSTGRHAIEGASIADVHGAILHFKFLGDFAQRAITEAMRGEHYDGAAEYKAYARLLKEEGQIELWTPDSLFYEGPAQLVRLGIMRSTAEWDARVDAEMGSLPQQKGG